MKPNALILFSIAWILALQSCSGSSSDPSNSTELSENSARKILQNIQPGDLVRASAKGDESRVHQLLQSGANVHESIEVLVPAHGDVAAHSETITPLLAAVAMGYENITSELINYQIKSPSAFQPTFQGYTAKDFLLYRGQNSTASLLR